MFYLGWFVYYLYLWWENCMPRLSCLVITTCRITNMFNYTYSHFTYFHDTTTSKRFCFQAKSLNGRILVLQSCVFLMGIEPTTSEFIHTSTWIIRMHVKVLWRSTDIPGYSDVILYYYSNGNELKLWCRWRMYDVGVCFNLMNYLGNIGYRWRLFIFL